MATGHILQWPVNPVDSSKNIVQLGDFSSYLGVMGKVPHLYCLSMYYILCMLSHVWLCSPMDCSPPGSSVCGILQARVLEWVTISLSRGSSWPRDGTRVSCRVSGFFTAPPGKPIYITLLEVKEWGGHQRRAPKEKSLPKYLPVPSSKPASEGSWGRSSPRGQGGKYQLWAACHGARKPGTWSSPPCRDLITPGYLYSSARFHLQRLTGDEHWRPQNRKHWRTPRPHTWKETLLLPNPKLDGFPQESPGSIFLAVCQRGSRMKFMSIAQCLAQQS